MTAENNKLNVVLLGFLRALLSRQDWIYLLSLLIPFLLYDLALKSYDVASRPGDHGLARTLDLMRADVFFDLGYILFWIGLFVAMGRGKKPVRWAMILLLHATTVLAVLVAACAHLYFQETGATLDYATIAGWIPKLDEIGPTLFQQGEPVSTWPLLFTVVFYGALGPLAVTRAVERWRGWPRRISPSRTPAISFLAPLGLWLLALGFGSLSLLVGFGSAGPDKSLARDPFVNVALTGVREGVQRGGLPGCRLGHQASARRCRPFTDAPDRES